MGTSCITSVLPGIVEGGVQKLYHMKFGSDHEHWCLQITEIEIPRKINCNFHPTFL